MSHSSTPSLVLIFMVHFLSLVFLQLTVETRRLEESSSNISAVLVFGDSTVDSGNNNYIKTVAKSNFPPYGKDFPNHIPTGRFTNGKLVTDFVGSYLGIKEFIPPYLDPTLTLDDLKTGVSFASASTGFDPLTAQLSSVISMEMQLNYFKEYKSRMEKYIGKERSGKVISSALFLISAGTNDFIANYYGPLLIRRKAYNISIYQNFILQLGKNFIQGLLEMGARKIGFVGVPPIGCVPAVITLHSDNALKDRVCIERLSSVARDYNRRLQSNLAALQSTTPTALILYFDIYKPIRDMVTNPHLFGFDTVNRGCCGSGIIEASVLCNPYSLVCPNDSNYIFWDSVHPTQAAYYHIFRAVRPFVDHFQTNH